MKTALAILGQLILFALFLALFFGGSLLGLFHADPFHAPHWFVSHPTPTTTRYFVPSGLLLMSIFWLIILGIEAAARRIRTAGLWTSVAFAVALVIGLIMKFGWVQPS